MMKDEEGRMVMGADEKEVMANMGREVMMP